ncbi:uncharacterized protein J4E87_003980 [Alternaria ethzedia]|uniref:uncharacterized protein n=1 Tax=Alternaria ethzedia TaxID=181014 RepID=UPI0020C3E547|nr:uncharacterized protein J4E87_003980 [Alternaria ethzedia]KAI4627417.1 hypothetical protein J4E87_003980 [Alternaria ethzedia]
MDIFVSQLPGLSVATHLSRELAKDDDENMPDNKSWRLGHSKQPKKPPRTSTPLKIDVDTPVGTDDSSDRRLQLTWRKTRQSSRPQTPVGGAHTTPVAEDADDAPSERSDTPALRRDSKPKLARYTSLFANFKETAKEPEFAFSAPWGEDAPAPFQTYIDPLDVVTSVRSHMITASWPIPMEHNSGLFRVFEDYRKVREQKECLSTMLEETLKDWRKAEEHWTRSRDRYGAEIRRLELLIARGASGMTGKTISHDSFPPKYDFFSHAQLDQEIKLMSQRALLNRPSSPSGKMAVLSTQFTNDMEDLPVGNPPQTSKNLTLSRKVQSELNLVAIQKTRPSRSFTSSVASGFSGGSGDPLPDEMTILEHTGMEPATECEALVALRALGTLVARRRGLEVNSFNHGLMMLFSQTRSAEKLTAHVEENDTQTPRQKNSSDNGTYEYFDQSLAPRNTLRKFQSQPQLNTSQKHHRQFSFEPGADQLEALTEELKALDGEANESGSDDSDTPLLMRTGRPALDTRSIRSASSSQTLGADLGKQSKIPSPVQSLGRSRRADSASSIQSVNARPQDSRRGSSSSVITAFRENSIGSMRPELQSRNSSINSLRMPDSPSALRNQHSGTGLRNTITAIAAARAASDASQSSSLVSSR